MLLYIAFYELANNVSLSLLTIMFVYIIIMKHSLGHSIIRLLHKNSGHNVCDIAVVWMRYSCGMDAQWGIKVLPDAWFPDEIHYPEGYVSQETREELHTIKLTVLNNETVN